MTIRQFRDQEIARRLTSFNMRRIVRIEDRAVAKHENFAQLSRGTIESLFSIAQ
jgi:hypothetical protein